MKYQHLGKSGLRVSPLSLGTMTFGGITDEAESYRIIDHAQEVGINFIDTADSYSEGESERIVGKAINKKRNSWILATKVANPMGLGPNRYGLSRRRVIEACEESLDRLATDYIDIYYLHKEDHDAPLEETLSALHYLLSSGKIRYFGISNYKAWRLAEICNICERAGIPRPIISQPYYNAMNRMPEVEHLPCCKYFGLGVFAYSPLARGVLTGKYKPGEAPKPESRAGRADKRMMQTEWREESLKIAQKIKAYCEARGTTATQFAIAWVLNNTLVTGTVIGPRTLDQCSQYVEALNYNFTEEDEQLVNTLVATGHPSTPGYNDPQYQIEGRISLIGRVKPGEENAGNI